MTEVSESHDPTINYLKNLNRLSQIRSNLDLRDSKTSEISDLVKECSRFRNVDGIRRVGINVPYERYKDIGDILNRIDEHNTTIYRYPPF